MACAISKARIKEKFEEKTLATLSHLYENVKHVAYLKEILATVEISEKAEHRAIRPAQSAQKMLLIELGGER